MKFFHKKTQVLSVEITPLIDIVFLLVIFFVVTSKIETNQYLSLELPETSSFSSLQADAGQNIVLLDTGILVINDQEFNITSLDQLMSGIISTFNKDTNVVLSIEAKAYHEWVIALMDALQNAGFQNIQIKTYTK